MNARACDCTLRGGRPIEHPEDKTLPALPRIFSEDSRGGFLLISLSFLPWSLRSQYMGPTEAAAWTPEPFNPRMVEVQAYRWIWLKGPKRTKTEGENADNIQRRIERQKEFRGSNVNWLELGHASVCWSRKRIIRGEFRISVPNKLGE